MALQAQEWTISGLSVELGIDRRTIGKKIAGVQPVRTDKKSKYYRMIDIVEALYLDPDTSSDLNKERTRLTKAQADKTELDVAEQKGRLVDIHRMSEIWASLGTIIRNKLTAIPTKAAPLVFGCKNIPQAKDILDAEIREVVTEITRTPPGVLAGDA